MLLKNQHFFHCSAEKVSKGRWSGGAHWVSVLLQLTPAVQVHLSDASQLLLFDAMMIILIKVLIISMRMIIIRRLNVVSPEKETMVKNA